MATSTTESRIGDVLKRLREQHGLSLRSLATRVGFSASFLSQVEHGQVSPSIGSLEKIAAELGVTLADLFQATESSGLAVIRAGARPGFTSSWSRARVEALTPQSADRRPLEAIVVTLAEGGSSGRRVAEHVTDQFAYVVAGPVGLVLDESSVTLDSGDAVVVPRNTSHRWENPGTAPAQVLLVSVRLPR
jgi:transcriptional regulator with XRE-family HTH domain